MWLCVCKGETERERVRERERDRETAREREREREGDEWTDSGGRVYVNKSTSVWDIQVLEETQE